MPQRLGNVQHALHDIRVGWFLGSDGNGLHYSGDSAVIDFLGHALSEATDREVVSTMLLQAAPLQEHRARFPAMLDGDAFTLAD
jgi:predicted amidohydrolase